MFDEKRFKITLMQKDKTINDIAEALDISIVTLYRKMNGESDFYRDEIQKICNFLNLKGEEREKIFFAEHIA